MRGSALRRQHRVECPRLLRQGVIAVTGTEEWNLDRSASSFGKTAPILPAVLPKRVMKPQLLSNEAANALRASGSYHSRGGTRTLDPGIMSAVL